MSSQQVIVAAGPIWPRSVLDAMYEVCKTTPHVGQFDRGNMKAMMHALRAAFVFHFEQEYRRGYCDGLAKLPRDFSARSHEWFLRDRASDRGDDDWPHGGWMPPVILYRPSLGLQSRPDCGTVLSARHGHYDNVVEEIHALGTTALLLDGYGDEEACSTASNRICMSMWRAVSQYPYWRGYDCGKSSVVSEGGVDRQSAKAGLSCVRWQRIAESAPSIIARTAPRATWMPPGLKDEF